MPSSFYWLPSGCKFKVPTARKRLYEKTLILSGVSILNKCMAIQMGNQYWSLLELVLCCVLNVVFMYYLLIDVWFCFYILHPGGNLNWMFNVKMSTTSNAISHTLQSVFRQWHTLCVVLAWYSNTLDLKQSNEYKIKVRTISCNFRVFTSIPCMNCSPFYS